MRDHLDFLEAEIPDLMTRRPAHRAAGGTTTAGDGPETTHTGGTS